MALQYFSDSTESSKEPFSPLGEVQALGSAAGSLITAVPKAPKKIVDWISDGGIQHAYGSVKNFLLPKTPDQNEVIKMGEKSKEYVRSTIEPFLTSPETLQNLLSPNSINQIKGFMDIIQKPEFSQTREQISELGDILSWANRPLYYAKHVGNFIVNRSKGTSAEEAYKTLIVDTAFYEGAGVALKIAGHTITEISGKRLNPITNQAEIKVSFTKKNLRDITERIHANFPVSTSDRALYDSVRQGLSTDKSLKQMITGKNKKVTLWVQEALITPEVAKNPVALLNKINDNYVNKASNLVQHTDISKVKSPQDFIKTKKPDVGLATTAYNLPEAKLAKYYTEPNKFKAITQTVKNKEGLPVESPGLAKKIHLEFLPGNRIVNLMSGGKSLAESMLKGEEPAFPQKVFTIPMLQHFNEEMTIFQSLESQIKQIESGIPPAEVNKKYTFTSLKGKELNLSISDQLGVYTLGLNPKGKRALKNLGVDDSILDQLTKKLTSTVPQVLQAITEFHKNAGQLTGQTYKDVTGETLALQENYSKLLRKKGSYNFDTLEEDELALMSTLKPLFDEKIAVPEGLTKKRTVQNYIPETNIFTQMQVTAKEVSKYTAWAAYAKEISRIMKASRPTLVKEYGPTVEKSLRLWVRDAILGSPPLNSAVEKGVKALSIGTYGYILTGNPLKVATVQLSSLANAANYVGWDNLIGAVNSIIANPSLLKDIYGSSNLLRTRFANINQADVRMLELLGTNKNLLLTFVNALLKGYSNTLELPMTMMDKLVAGAEHLAAMKQWVANGGDQRGALNYADTVLIEAQQMSQDMFRPEGMRRSVTGRIVSPFSSQQFQIGASVEENVIAVLNGNKSVIDFTRSIINHWVIPSVIVMLTALEYVSDKYAPKDDKELAWMFTQGMFTQFPLVSQYLGNLEYNEGEIKFPFTATLEIPSKKALRLWKDQKLDFQTKVLGLTATGVEGILGIRGINLRVPKAVYSFTKTFLEGEPNWDILKNMKPPQPTKLNLNGFKGFKGLQKGFGTPSPSLEDILLRTHGLEGSPASPSTLGKDHRFAKGEQAIPNFNKPGGETVV